MKKSLFPALAASLLLVLLAGVSAAQAPGAVELGYDLGFNVLMVDDIEAGGYTYEGEDVIVFGVPNTAGLAQTLRFGFCVTERSEIEPSFGMQLVNADDETVTELGLGLSYLHNLGSATTRPYLRASGRMYLLSGDEETSTQFGVGIGAGAKTRIGDRLALRYEAGATRQFESDSFAARWDLGLAFGVSFFSK